MRAGDVAPHPAGIWVVIVREWGGEGAAERGGYGSVVGVGVGAEGDGLVRGVRGFGAGEFLEPSSVLARVLPQGVILH